MYHFEPGNTPLIISMPHSGTLIPDTIAERMTSTGQRLEDTDWHVERLYDFARQLGASMLWAKYSRYVIDLNRSPDGHALYPGSSNTELCPLTSFAEEPLYRPYGEPDHMEIASRHERFWKPYHEQLCNEIRRLRRIHGKVLLFEAHSIRSQVPRFFPGKLPDLNLGTGGGTTASPDLIRELYEVCQRNERYTAVLDARFKGGYITRHYGHPECSVHAVQLELAQCTYMSEQIPFDYDEESAAGIRPLLRSLLEFLLTWAGQNDACQKPGPDSPGMPFAEDS